MATAAASVTTGPSGTPRRSYFTFEAYDTTPPTNTSLAPGTEVSLAPTMPPVSDSAAARVWPRSRSMSSTTDSIVSPSTPKMSGPSTLRTSTSSASSSAATAAASAPLAVIRTLRPSPPEARNASVAVPVRSSSSMRSASSSARPDSDSPQVRRVRLPMTAPTPARRCRSGRTVPVIISFISQGTPGTA